MMYRNHKLRRSCYKKYVARILNDDKDESFNPRVEREDDDFLEKLFHRRGNIREEGLATMLEGFRAKIQLELAENNFATILYRCENSIKKGLPVEIKLACEAIGLLALTVGPGKNGNEIYRDCLDLLPQALSHKSKALKSKAQPIPILECLAIVTFVGAEDFGETERSMKIIWEYIINQKSEINVSSKKESALVTAAAISAWSFLLTTIDRWRLDHKYWKGVIPYFLELLEAEAEAENENENEVEVEVEAEEMDIKDEAEEVDIDNEANINEAEGENKILYLAVVEALALVFEKGSLEKFYIETNESLCNVSNLFKDKKTSHQTSLNIYGTILTFSTWYQLKKMTYLKHFLGNGFRKHVVDNEFLRDDVFQYKPTGKILGTVLYIPEMEEITAEIFIPDIRNKDCHQRLFKSPNSIMSKGKTKLLKKQRLVAQGMKTGHYYSILDETEVP